jgi:hypothetical protein
MQRNDASAPTAFRTVWVGDLDADTQPHIWLWHGYLAVGAVTLLTSPWKSGKTTLVSALLRQMATGGELAGLAVRLGKAAIVSEESIVQWRLRKQKFGFGAHVCWICRPFRGRPCPEDWLALLDHLGDLRREHGIDLVVIDPLAEFLPVRNEALAGGILDGLLPLQRLTTLGVAVLLLHHPRKQGRPDSRWARGSGALSGFADILIEMDYHVGPTTAVEPDRCRRVTAYSRFDETPRSRVIELVENGIEYRSLGDFAEAEFVSGWHDVQTILDEATKKLSRREILERWPAAKPRPVPETIWRWLDRAVADGLALHDGDGRRSSPFRYWNRSLETKWEADPLLRLMAQSQDDARRLLGESE